MNWWYALTLFGTTALLAVARQGRASAADRGCGPLTVEADAALLAGWPEMVQRVHQAFAAREDIDACARVELRSAEGAIAVAVMLPDGRIASRSVARREDLLPTLEALLLMPDRQKPTPELEPSPTAPRRALPSTSTSLPSLPALAADSDRGAVTGRAESPAPALRVEFSVLAGARMGDGQLSAGVGALPVVDLAGWLLGVEARLDAYRSLGGSASVTALELALLAGRRFRFQTLALDVAAGPALSGPTGSSSTSRAAVVLGGPAISEPLPAPEPRRASAPHLLAAARLNFAARSLLGAFVGIDGQFALSRAPSDAAPHDEPRLPAWTLGLELGATVGMP